MLQLYPRSFLVALATACLISVALGAALSKAAPRAQGPALAMTTSLGVRLQADGNIIAWQEASVSADSNALRLTEVRVDVGDTVRAGQVLAVFSTDTLQAELAQSRASLREARANAAEAAANAERAHTLQASGALSLQQIQQYTTASETAAARAEAAQAALSAQQLRLRYAQVLAPDSGVISARTAAVGAMVGAGTELFRIVRKGRLEWCAELASSDLHRVHVGTQVRVALVSGDEVEGTVRLIAPTVDKQTRNALVYVSLPAHPDIRVGMSAHGDFLLAQGDTGRRVATRQNKAGQRTDDRLEAPSGMH